MKKNVWSKDGKRTVNMYPESLREVTFGLNLEYSLKKNYYWTTTQKKKLFSPTRVINLTSDKSGLAAWRRRVGPANFPLEFSGRQVLSSFRSLNTTGASLIIVAD